MLIFPESPCSAISRLKKTLVPLGELMSVESGCNIRLDEDENSYVYVFLEGELNVKRTGDNIVLADVHESHIFGLAEMFQSFRSNILQAKTKCLVVRVNGENVIKEIERNNLWEDVVSILNFHIEYIMYRELLIMRNNALSIVYHYLQMYNDLSEEVKSCTNLRTYIKERTGLSKSSVVNSIRVLKKRKYIDCKRGGVDLQINEIPLTFNDHKN